MRKLSCFKCGHVWRGDKPKRCPNPPCKSTLWNDPERTAPGGDKGGRPRDIIKSEECRTLKDQHGEYALVPLTQKQFAKVDLVDLPEILQTKWCAVWDKTVHGFYAQRGEWNKETKAVKQVAMARQLMGYPVGMKVDHADHDTLNNRRSNLRIVSDYESAQNTRKGRRKTVSKFKGVDYHKQSGKWRARISVNGKSITIGRFASELKAATAYRVASQKFHGNFGCIEVIG